MNEELFLPSEILLNADFKSCHIITIEEENKPVFRTQNLEFNKIYCSNAKPVNKTNSHTTFTFHSLVN